MKPLSELKKKIFLCLSYSFSLYSESKPNLLLEDFYLFNLFLKENKGFFDLVTNSKDTLQLIFPLCIQIILDFYTGEPILELYKMVVNTMAQLCLSDAFAINLNANCKEDFRIEGIPLIVGTYYDIWVLAICKGVKEFHSGAAFNSIMTQMFCTLANCSFYIQNLNHLAAEKYCETLKIMASLDILLKSTQNIQNLIRAIRVFDNALIYQNEVLLFFNIEMYCHQLYCSRKCRFLQ